MRAQERKQRLLDTEGRFYCAQKGRRQGRPRRSKRVAGFEASLRGAFSRGHWEVMRYSRLPDSAEPPPVRKRRRPT